MSSMSRRLFLGASAAGLGSAAIASAAAQETAATGAGTVSVEEALRRRESIRLYTSDPIPEEQLLRLLWAANGINRPDVEGRTAPSGRGASDVDIYVATAEGVSRYDFEAQTLEPHVEGDVRQVGTAAQRFVHAAPAVLIFVSDKQKLADAGYPRDDEAAMTQNGRVHTAFVSQNVYLFAAAEGLGTCVVGGFERAPLEEALGFGEDLAITYIQPVGYPAH